MQGGQNKKQESGDGIWQMEPGRLVRMAALIFCLLGGGALIYFGAKILLPILAPFLLAWLLSLIVHPLAEKLSKKLHLPVKVCAAVLVVLAVGAVGGIVAVLINRLFCEVHRLVSNYGEESAAVTEAVESVIGFFSAFSSHLPFLNRPGSGADTAALRQSIDEAVSALLSAAISRLGGFVTSAVGGFLTSLPIVLLFLLVTVLSCFYFSMDADKVGGALRAVLPVKWQGRLPSIRRRFGEVVLRYLRAYFLLFLITFAQLLLGLTLLGTDYAVLLSLLTAFVDILPVFGTGTVLLPWAAVKFIAGDAHMGGGLLILYGVILFVRQVLEPRILGGSLGLHPLLTLIAIYAGLRLFGVFGMILGPAICLLLKNLIFDNQKKKPTGATTDGKPTECASEGRAEEKKTD